MSRNRLDATFAALAAPTRRAILARLASGDAGVMQLAKPFAMSQPAISKHLKVLERAGLISRARRAQSRPCRLQATPLRKWPIGSSATDATGKTASRASTPTWADCNDRRREMDAGIRTSAPSATQHELTIRRTLNAPRELVFRAWTEPQHLAQWSCPRGFTMIENRG